MIPTNDDRGVGADPDNDDVLFSTIPNIFDTRLGQLTTATPIGAAMSDGNVVTFSPAGTLGNIALTDVNGDPLDGAPSGLFTLDGNQIFLYTDSTNDNIVLGREGDGPTDDDDNSSGDIVFAIYLEETGGNPPTGAKFWTVQYEAIDHGDDTNDFDSAVDMTNKVFVTAFEANDFDFAGAPPGDNLFMWFGDVTQSIIVTGRDPANQSEGENISSGDTTNTSGQTDTSLGTNGQQFKAGEGMYFTFATGSTSGDDFLVPNLDQNEADVEANITPAAFFDARGAAFTISQVNPGSPSTSVAIKITAYTTDFEAGVDFVDGLGDADDVAVAITDVTINGMSVAFVVDGDGVIVSGVVEGDEVGYTAAADTQRVLIENAQPTSGQGKNISFDIGGFTLTQVAGDTDEVGSNIFFEDDGPAIDLTPLSPTIAVDESVGTAGSSQDEPGNAQPDDETDSDVPALAIGFTEVAAATLFSETADAGSDGEDSTVYSLVLNAGATGLTDTASGLAVVLTDNAGVIEGRTLGTNLLVFTITVDASTGDVEVAQFRALDHGADTNDHDSDVSMASGLVELQALLTDNDSDTASDKIELGSLIEFEDDGPVVTVADLTGTFTTAVQSSTWSDSPGTDGFKSLNITLDSYTIDANSTVNIDDDLGTLTMPDGMGNFVFMGSITDDFTDDGIVNEQTVDFTLTFDDDGTYDFQLTTPPSSVVEISSADGSLDAGGPDPVRTLTVDSTDIVFSAVEPTTAPAAIVPFLDTGEMNIEDNTTFLSTDEMNVSNAGIGNDNNNFNGNADPGVDGDTTNGGKTDESFVVDPDSDISSMKVFIDNSVSGYNTDTEELYYRVFYNDGTFDAMLTLVEAGDLTAEAGRQVSFVVGDPMGESNIDAVQLFMGTGTVKIPVIEFTITEEFDPEPLDMSFTATLVDDDDDSSMDTFDIDLMV